MLLVVYNGRSIYKFKFYLVLGVVFLDLGVDYLYRDVNLKEIEIRAIINFVFVSFKRLLSKKSCVDWFN